MATQASKKKKVKGKTLNLNEFLSSDKKTSAPATSYVSKSWAEQTDEASDMGRSFADTKAKMNRVALPTAPRSAQPAELDYSKLPDKPPYTVYLGNIPFDADEEDITMFLRSCNVSQVRLPREGDRLKGFGYAEVDDIESLTAALQLNDQTIRSRRIRVDLAGQGHQEGKDDRTNSDWRNRGDGGFSGFSGRGSYGGRRNDDSGFGTSGSESSNWRQRTVPIEESSGGFDQGGFRGDRGFGGDREPSSGGWRNRSADQEQGFGGDQDRGFGGDRNRGFGGDRDRGFGGDRDRGYGGDRDRGGYSGNWERSYGGERRDRGYDRSRSQDFESSAEPKDYGSEKENQSGAGTGYSRDDDQYERKPDDDAPRERKKLVLTKKSDQSTDSSVGGRTSSAIFGGAKPVDTAARERLIEERLERERLLEEQERMKVEKDKEPIIKRERPERPRRESEGEGRTRHSSSSSGKGGPRPIIARRESERSNEDDGAFYKEEPLSPTSPTTPKSPKTPVSPRQDDINLQNVVPAPPPKENAWAKRSENVTSPPPPSSPPVSPQSGDGEGRLDKGKQLSKDGAKESNWKRDGSSGRPAGRGQGRKPGDGVGRSDRRKDENRRDNRSVRKTPSEMPKYEKPAAPNWSQPTKFSGLMADNVNEDCTE